MTRACFQTKRPASLCGAVRYRCAPGDGWATSRERAGRTLAELLTCARPGCTRRVRAARPHVPADVAALCPVCRTQYCAYRSKSLGLGTNNHAEVSAVRVALAITESYRDRLLVVRTDSQYTIGALTAPADPEPWAANAKLLGLVRRAMVGRAVQFEHVKGHAGIAGNERADVLAGLARRKGLTDTKGMDTPASKAKRQALRARGMKVGIV